MSSLDHAAAFPVYVTVFGVLAFASIAGCLLWFRIARHRKREAETLTSRCSKLGLATAVVERAPPEISVVRPAAVPIESAAPPGKSLSLASGFPAIVALSGRDDLDPKRVLAQLVDLLPSALPSASPLACRIEMQGSVWWSSGYLTPQREFSAPLNVNSAEVGSIILGHSSEPTEADSDVEALLQSTAVVVSKMLERHSDQIQLAQLRAELRQQKMTLTQMQRFIKAGSWEYRCKDASFHWSDEVRRMVGMDAAGKLRNEAEKTVTNELVAAVEDAVQTRKPLSVEFNYALRNGETRWLHASGDVEVGNGEVARIVGVIRDVSEEKATLHRLAQNANHDFLTELPNRRYLQARLEAALVERSAMGGLLILDIDRFKDLNDTSGHDVGDMLLHDFSRHLYESATGAFVARLGGDEFAVLFTDMDAMTTEYRARALLAALKRPVVVFGGAIPIRVSAGLAIFPTDARHSSELMKSADLALYEAKKRGRDVMVRYAPEFRAAIDRRKAVCAEVRQALPERQFVPFYQPKISLEDGRVAGFEALLRWNHPSGIRSPGQILPALADPVLSRALCEAMLERILLDVASWQAKNIPFGCVAFNASSSEFGEFDLASNLLRRLKSMGIATSSIGVEVTETVFLNGAADSIRATLGKLQDAGVEIALDDFGTGFASLSHLQDFPVDTIKIDQSFIRGLATDDGSKSITSAVLGLGQSLGKTVVAEGVETEVQAQILRASGCDQVQGYLFARPMPTGEVPAFLENWRGLDAIAALEQKAA